MTLDRHSSRRPTSIVNLIHLRYDRARAPFRIGKGAGKGAHPWAVVAVAVFASRTEPSPYDCEG